MNLINEAHDSGAISARRSRKQMRTLLTCEHCGASFDPPTLGAARKRQRFCSRACFGAARTAKASAVTERRCSRCGTTKALDEFWPDASKATGWTYWCKACRLDHRRGDGHAAEQRYLKSEVGRATLAKNTAKTRSDPLRYRAHMAVQMAVASGALVAQPCEVCGSTHRTHAHHDDYAKPLDVRWLCPLHHRRHHAELRRNAEVSSEVV